MTPEIKHTPTYKIGTIEWNEVKSKFQLWIDGGKFGLSPILCMDKEALEFIVRCVNNHEALLEAAKEVVVEWATPLVTGESLSLQKLDDAVRQAEKP